ncbi:MAG TPA: antibiotic biosynthesis monooxygenase family protein, partial [Bacteroidota bacterium]
VLTNINQPYTLGVWTARPGQEKAFIAEWERFAKWTSKNYPGAETGYLLQDPEHPQQFISFGPWKNNEAIKAWRESPEFKAFVVKARELCEDFKPRSLVSVASSKE